MGLTGPAPARGTAGASRRVAQERLLKHRGVDGREDGVPSPGRRAGPRDTEPGPTSLVRPRSYLEAGSRGFRPHFPG